MMAAQQRDYGPMLKAEERALISTGENCWPPEAQPLLDDEMQRLEPEPVNAPPRWYNALAPIGAMSLVLIDRAIQPAAWTSAKMPTGWNLTLYNIIGAADPFQVLLWAAFTGTFSPAWP